MEAGTTSTTLTARLPILNLGEYDLWLMRIEQYFLMTDYSLWEVILNGNKVLKRIVEEVEQEYEPTSAEEKQDRRNKMKARGTLLMALPNKDQLKFYSYKDAKLLMEAIEKSSETMDQTFDRLQKLISQLEIQGEVITQEDMNLKLLRSLPSEWKTHALIWRNKEEIETISLDDLYNNLKIYEPELTGSSSTSQNPQNVAFVSSNSTNSNNNTNEADNTTYGVSAAHTQSNPTSGDNLSDAVICAFLASQPNSPQLAREDLEQIDPDDLEEMDLQWEMAMLTIRARRFIKRTGRKLDVNGQRVGFDRGRENSRRTVTVETPTKNALVAQDGIGGKFFQFRFRGLESVEARLAHYKKNEVVFEESINVLNLEVKLRDNALVENKKKLEKAEKERDELKLTLEKFQNSSKSLNNLLESQVCDKFKTGLGYNAASPAVESFVNSSEMLENQEYNKSKSDKGYHAVPPPYIGNFIPSKPDLTFMDEIVKSENIDVITIVTPSNVKKVESNHESADVKNNSDAVEPKTVRKNSFRPLVIEDWNSNDDSKVEFIPNVKDKTVRPSTEKIKFVNSARETVEKVIRPVWNNTSRVNHKNFANKMTHPHPNRRFVPQAVLTKSGKINTAGASVNTAVRPVNTVGSKPTVNHPRPISKAYKKDIHKVKDTTARDRAIVNENKGKRVNVVKASTSWEEFVQAIPTFLTNKANLGSPTKKGRKDKAHVIPYCRFTKLIICHLRRTNNIHQRSASPFHLAEEDLRLGMHRYYMRYLESMIKKLQPKRKERRRMQVPSNPSQTPTPKPPKPKPAKEKSTKAAPLQKAGNGKVTKVRNVKNSFQLVDEPDEEPAQPEPEPEPELQGEGEEYDVERAIQMSLELFHASILHTPKRRSTMDQFIFQRRTPVTKEASTGPSAQPQDDTSANVVRDSPSPADAETGAESDKTNSGDEDQAGPDPGESGVALDRLDPEPTHDKFMANLYPKVQESLKFSADEHVILEDPLSSTGTLSSMKNLEDAYTIGDQFINDKSTEDELEKLNVEAEVVSMVIVPIYQASSLVPPLSTPVIDLSPPKPASSTTQAPIFTATTTTTTTTLPPPP
ncbi:hypothetical protein Tco_1275665 [Tanacetum coccineum]